jgi:hypothetical protein
MLHFVARLFRRWLPAIMWTSGLCAQTCLVLSPPTITADGSAEFDLSLYSPRSQAPVAIQWTFQYATSSISSLTVKDESVLNTSLKTAICAGDTGVYNCVTAGLNKRAIVNGIIAKVTAVLAPGASSATIQIGNPNAVTSSGSPIPVVARIRSSDGPDISPDCSPIPRPGSVANKK